MSRVVVDASAVLALLNRESGAETVAEAVVGGAAISAVNFAEVVGKLAEAGVPEAVMHEALDPLGLEVASFDAGMAYRAGLLRPLTRPASLSLGDRACLALAGHLGVPALTADQAWEGLDLGVTLRVIR